MFQHLLHHMQHDDLLARGSARAGVATPTHTHHAPLRRSTSFLSFPWPISLLPGFEGNAGGQGPYKHFENIIREPEGGVKEVQRVEHDLDEYKAILERELAELKAVESEVQATIGTCGDANAVYNPPAPKSGPVMFKIPEEGDVARATSDVNVKERMAQMEAEAGMAPAEDEPAFSGEDKGEEGV